MPEHPRIEDLRRRVQKDPASIAFAQLAEEYRRAGQYQESIDACHAGLEVHPNYLSARVTLGRALIELGKLDDALPQLELVLKSAPENLAAIRGIADAHHRQGDFAKALEFYKRALALARNDPDLEQTVADLTQQITPTKRPETKDGLSFEQMQSEMIARGPSPAAVAAAASTVSLPPAPPSAAPHPASLQPSAQQSAEIQLPARHVTDAQPAAQQATDTRSGAQQPADMQPAAQQAADAQPAAQEASDVQLPPGPPTVLQPTAAQPPAPQPPTPQALQPADLYPPAAQVVTSRHNEAGRGRAERTVAALEEWLQAIDVTRANRSA
jgi:tetratricopeptide (TPR) repeat protein